MRAYMYASVLAYVLAYVRKYMLASVCSVCACERACMRM